MAKTYLTEGEMLERVQRLLSYETVGRYHTVSSEEEAAREAVIAPLRCSFRGEWGRQPGYRLPGEGVSGSLDSALWFWKMWGQGEAVTA